jgi:hypothetical protein
MPNEEMDRAKELLSQIYMDLKLYREEKYKITEDRIIQEKEYIKDLSIIELINFISNYINLILEIKKENNESFLEENDQEKPLYKQYEELLIKAENDIRKHIKVRKYFY